MKKILSFLFLFPLFVSCEKDDEVYVETIDYTIEKFNVNNHPSEDNNSYHISLEVVTESPFESMAVVFSHSSGYLPGGNNREYELQKKPNGFGRSFIYLPEHELPNGTLSITLKVREKNADSFQIAKTVDVMITWDYDIPSNDANEKVHIIQQLEQTHAPGQEFSGLVSFAQHSLSEGYLAYQVYSYGSPIGTEQHVALIGHHGSFHIGNLGILNEGELYQLVVRNIDPSYPTYRFVDENGETILNNGTPISSIIIEFIASSLETISATMVSHSFVDVTSHSFATNGSIQKNFDEEKIISAKVFFENSYVTESVFVTNPGAGEEDFSLVFNGLQENTSYTVKYFLDNQSESFFEAEITTSQPGQFVANIGIIDNIVPNGGRAQVIFTNQTSQDISGELTFSSLNYSESFEIIFQANTVNQISYQQTDGHRQYSLVEVELLVNGESIANTDFMTSYVEYNNIKNLNSDGSTSESSILHPNQSATLSQFKFESNGVTETQSFELIFESENAYPWDYFNTLGLSNYENIPVNQQSHWTDLGNHRYSVTFNLNKEIVMSVNSFLIYATTKAYTEATEFSYETVITDMMGQEISNSIEPLLLEMQ